MIMTIPYKTIFELNGKVIESPIERDEVSIEVNFEESSQGNIETGSFTFVNQAFTQIKDWNASGLNGGVGILEGIPFDISIQSPNEKLNVFKGSLRPSSYQDLSPDEPKILMQPIKADGINNLSERLEGLTFAFLESIGAIRNSDYKEVNIIVEKKNNAIELALLSISIYLMIKEVAEAIQRLQENIATISALLSTGLGGIGSSLLYAILSAAFELAYITVMIIALKDLVLQLTSSLLPIPKKRKGIVFRTALTKVFEYLGYNFISSIPDLEYTYFPSKADGRQDKGIPFDSDFGFVASEFVDLCNRMFRSEIVVIGNDVRMLTEYDPFLENQSTFVLPDVIEQPFSYNIADLKESRLISFRDDISDEYTVDNWKGTSYVITTRAITSINPKNSEIKGFDEIRIPLSLGNRKDRLSSLEKALNSFFKAVGFVFSIFGDNQTQNLISNRVGLVKVSNEFFNTPKVLKLNGNGKLPSDYRTGLSAKYLYDNYINTKSFVANNFKKQRRLFQGVEIPFSFKDYKEVIQNSYFTTNTGKRGKINSLVWSIDADTAEIDYYIEDIYTKNLKEEFIETE